MPQRNGKLLFNMISLARNLKEYKWEHFNSRGK
eukprot:CAMPEP_0194173018 /NCGR_PEP_ID=MMETSP0154-20130528/7406_1 /TAXON_ID=1049557 /ORGANISM="Thalassiothrix antarctica, Strain L6-D1" /LENGTH=32 /DNA_ID= /DNA_START= /DNA_END= /DNA_ORIENTATION=